MESLKLKIHRKKWPIFLLLTFAFLLIIFFFSFRLLEVPPGINGDEAAIGYNAILISKTARDENGRFLPFFILSHQGKDWIQPVTVYTTSLAFKIFPPSFYLLRFVSVFFLLLSLVLIFYLLNSLAGFKLAFLGSFIFLLTPIMMIQSHLGFDNIAPVPFELLWLIGVFKFSKTKKIGYLILSGISLGVGFYSYKAMRAIVPIYALLTTGYLFHLIKTTKISLKFLFPFIVSLLPFFLIIPILETKYPGAVFDHQQLHLMPYYEFFYGLLANLDWSFLFIKGDSTFYHSTGKHGELLLTTLPFFLVGVYQTIRKKEPFFMLVLFSFLLTPTLFGFVGSVFRASRLLSYVPLYAIISGYGALYLWQNQITIKLRQLKIHLIGLIMILCILNYIDFINYYWFEYARFVVRYFENNSHDSYRILAKEAKVRRLEPYIEQTILQSDGYAGNFFAAAYFENGVGSWNNKSPKLAKNSILMTNTDSVVGMEPISNSGSKFHIFVSTQ